MDTGYPPRKPLYLTGSEPASVELDGPSLVVRREGEAGRRFPLGRLSRVVAAGPVRWSQEALAGCLDHGLTLTLLAPDGRAHGFGLPACDPATRINQQIEEFLSRGDWAGRYRDWFRAYERREILFALKLLGLRCGDLRPAAVTGAIENRIASAAPLPFCRRVKAEFEGLLASRIAEHSQRAELAAQILMDRRPGFHFLRDWTAALAWRLWPDTGHFLARFLALRRAASGPPLRTGVRDAYERLHEREDRRIARYLDTFRFWLGGLEQDGVRRGRR